MLGTANCGLRERTLTAFLLPLLAGGGWEGGLLIFQAKSNPTLTLPCEQGREHNLSCSPC
jgi:hypothetical protein